MAIGGIVGARVIVCEVDSDAAVFVGGDGRVELSFFVHS